MEDSHKKLKDEAEEKEIDSKDEVELEGEEKEVQEDLKEEQESDSEDQKDNDLEEEEEEEEEEEDPSTDNTPSSQESGQEEDIFARKQTDFVPEEVEKDEPVEEESGQTYSSEVKFHGFNPNETNKSDIFYEPPRKKKSMKKFIIWLTVLSVLALVAGFFATMAFKNNIKEEVKKVEATATPVPTPTPEPKPELDRAEWSLEVLNGSGISGQAKKTADAIKELGYVITKSGNADKQTYEESQIFVSEDLKDKVELLITDLKDVIRIATIAGTLKESTPSARIIIGKDIQ